MTRKNPKICIVGGVAGGASCAARARRLSESASITIFEQGPFVSFANCGLPYYVGRVIRKEDSLLLASPELFKKRFNIDVRVHHEVLSIDPGGRTIEVQNQQDGSTYRETYDALVLSPGSRPVRPPMEGIDLPGIFPLWTIPDSRKIKSWITRHKARRAVVLGGGFIGLEMAENLHHLGLKVTIVELQNQVMTNIDPEMAAFVHTHLKKKRIDLRLETRVSGFHAEPDHRLGVRLASGRVLPTDLVLLAVGVRPRTELAAEAGLQIGESGGIRVNAQMQTSDAHIWAVGDAVETTDIVTGSPCVVPLAGPANRQGRVAAEAILCDPSQAPPSFRGVQATSVCGVLGLTVAATGANEKRLAAARYNLNAGGFEKIYLHPDNHAGYYPGADAIALKLIFSRPEGRILGAQAVGSTGVAKRIDVIATAIQHGSSIFDLAEAELCYAPQYGSAKDPVNLAGMIASNVLQGYAPVCHWGAIPEADPYILDVREPEEYQKGCVPGAVNIPLGQLRARMGELPSDRPIRAHCYVGQRSYYAVRILRQHGLDAYNISGGFRLYEISK